MRAGKTLAASINPKEARAAVVKHLKRLNSAVNVTQFTAQLHERDMIELLVDMAENVTMPPSIRRQCAIDVLTFARGQPRPWIHDGETVDPNMPGTSGLGATVGQEIEAARQTAKLHQQLAMLSASNVHPRDWPEEVRQIAGDMVAFYEQEDGIVDVKAT